MKPRRENFENWIMKVPGIETIVEFLGNILPLKNKGWKTKKKIITFVTHFNLHWFNENLKFQLGFTLSNREIASRTKIFLLLIFNSLEVFSISLPSSDAYHSTNYAQARKIKRTKINLDEFHYYHSNEQLSVSVIASRLKLFNFYLFIFIRFYFPSIISSTILPPPSPRSNDCS